MPRRRTVKVPPLSLPVLVVLLLVILGKALFDWLTRPTVGPAPAEGYLFCAWNVENLFDDRDDPALRDDDEDWFGTHPDAVREKIGLLVAAILVQNNGHGPDILAVVEVENRRAVELLRDGLNARLPEEWRYRGIAHRDNLSGRRIEPAILTRLPIVDDRSHNFGIRRILEARIDVDGAPLTILASHWTSRLREGTAAKRAAYADALYQDFLVHYRADVNADVLIAGDFNDEPDDPSVRDHLHATGDVARVRSGGPRPFLLDLLAGRDRNSDGTEFYKSRWQIFDQIVVSPGLLDPKGWQVVPGSLRIENRPELRARNRDGRPKRFGNARNPNPRGPSDHFAVTVRLTAPSSTKPEAAKGGADW